MYHLIVQGGKNVLKQKYNVIDIYSTKQWITTLYKTI